MHQYEISDINIAVMTDNRIPLYAFLLFQRIFEMTPGVKWPYTNKLI